jgi:replicative DNA helicase
MTISLEKIFFVYILKNKKFFDIVDPHFFKNTEIQFVYKILKEYYLKNKEADVPHPKQILEMVQLEDRDGMITKEILKSILIVNLQEYDEQNFIVPKMNAWILTNKIKSGIVDIIDETRNLDLISELEEVLTSATKIRDIVDTMSKTDFINDEDDLGSDFDDAEVHLQDSQKYKVKTGFATIDHILGGGWDVQTLNILMGMSNSGKSLWMQNLAVKTANLGHNVLYITLEMSEKKVMKRLGSMRLKIPINDYDVLSKDTNLIKQRIKNLTKVSSGLDLFENKTGKIITKFWAAGTVQVTDFDAYIQKLKEKKGIKIDLLIVDYIALIAVPKNSGGDNLYTKGKYVAEGLRALAAKWNFPVITAVQLAKDAWNSSDLTLESVPESKAIVETCDTFFGIIRTEEMRRQNLYRFKLLKQRDGDFLKSQIKLDLNPTYLTLENDQFIDALTN